MAASVTEARIPLLDALIGGAEPTNLNADITVTQADGFKGGTIAEELELWRKAGGTLDVLVRPGGGLVVRAGLPVLSEAA